MQSKAYLFFIALAASLCFTSYTLEAQRPVVIAHRGNHQHAPENTIRAFNDAIAVGVDFVEVDLRTTRDSVLVVMHDETVNRTTQGTGRVDQLTWAELQKLNAVDKSHPEKATDRIPTFEDVLQLCKGKVKIYLDFKAAAVAATVKAIQKFDMQSEVVVYINSIDQYYAWRKEAPTFPLMVSLPSYQLADATQFLAKYPAEILDGSFKRYTPELINWAHQNGKRVWVDIQQPHEDADFWSEVLKSSFDGLQTDHPEALIAYLKKRGLR